MDLIFQICRVWYPSYRSGIRPLSVCHHWQRAFLILFHFRIALPDTAVSSKSRGRDCDPVQSVPSRCSQLYLSCSPSLHHHLVMHPPGDVNADHAEDHIHQFHAYRPFLLRFRSSRLPQITPYWNTSSDAHIKFPSCSMFLIISSRMKSICSLLMFPRNCPITARISFSLSIFSSPILSSNPVRSCLVIFLILDLSLAVWFSVFFVSPVTIV